MGFAVNLDMPIITGHLYVSETKSPTCYAALTIALKFIPLTHCLMSNKTEWTCSILCCSPPLHSGGSLGLVKMEMGLGCLPLPEVAQRTQMYHLWGLRHPPELLNHQGWTTSIQQLRWTEWVLALTFAALHFMPSQGTWRLSWRGTKSMWVQLSAPDEGNVG